MSRLIRSNPIQRNRSRDFRVIVLLFFVTLGGSIPARSSMAQTSTSQSSSVVLSNVAQGNVPPVDTNVSYEGFSEAIQDVNLSTEEVGQLVDVPVTLGQLVRKGDVIAQLDDRLDRASVEVSRMQASMEGEIRAALATRQMQQFRVEQLSQLRDDQMAGVDELRRAQTELAISEARLLVAQEQQRLRQVELERLELQIERRKLRAPFDGLVAEKSLDAGEAVTPTNLVVIRLVRVDKLIGVFNVPAERSFAMKPGLATQVYFRAARETVDGVIDSISPVINGESGTVQVRVRIDNQDGKLRPGDRCSMRVSPVQQITQREKRLQR
ncbi:efflux RND transporter periplasmic adaptor subunit [Neorhodopirellula pilleata]|uniref:Cobalt-zinc-cadmium resistance protein CzcB n=1 Tax=Neorhodopirellula pilleata TaxID=2714738 RepID=A0A5C5ZLS7_9BACT|nr:efflux RND transporter periplasmic adaptor subunit [Neorhodopirellula pilleata]TWT87937.1 Cobalt-zinc-cadmium resistance protein CzcB [Neorhodopirellula pilleata]